MRQSLFLKLSGLLLSLLVVQAVSGVGAIDRGFFTNSVKIGGSSSTAAPSAALDINSITKGLLIPRMTEAQRDAISSPATGLIVYNTDTDALNYYNGATWGAVGAFASPMTTDGDMIYQAGGVPDRLAIGNSDEVMLSNGTGPVWSLLFNESIDPNASIDYSKLAVLTASRVLVSDGSGFVSPSAVASSDIQNATKLQGVNIHNAAPTDTYVLTYNSSATRWEPRATAAAITLPVSSTDNAVVLWSGTGGNSIKDSSVTISGSAITGSLTGNASTATALAANPSDCAANNFATTIAANGNLTCSQVGLTTGVTGVLPIANGGTNNGSLGVTAGGAVYTDGSKLANTGAGTTGYLLQSFGSGPPVWTPAPTTAPGINMLKDYDWNAETGGTTFWSEVGGGSISASGTFGNAANGAFSIAFDALAATDYLASSSVAIPAGLYGQNCLADFWYKGFDSNITFQVHDGTNVIASQALTASTNHTRVQVNFPCPSSGNLQLRFLASANAAIGYVDEVYLGSATNLSNFTGPIDLGTETWTTSWANDNNAVVKLTRDGEYIFIDGSITVTGAGATGQTVTIPAAYTMAQATAGALDIVGNGFLYDTGTTSFPALLRAETTTTFKIYANSVSGSFTSFSDLSSTSPHTWANTDIMKFRASWRVANWNALPAAALNNSQNWRVDANISGANPSLGTSAVSSYTEVIDAGLTLTNNSGSGILTAQIPCSTTNPPTGTTCSAGSESVGVSFTMPRAGDVRACAHFAWQGSADSSGDAIAAAFQIVETPTNAQTISQEGKSRVSAQFNNSAAVATAFNTPFQVCGTFTFASAGQKVLRLMYEQLISSTPTGSVVIADANASVGQRDIHWEVYPIDQQAQAPTLVGSVTSQYSGPLKIETARLTCSGSSAITQQFGTWVSSIGNISSGACTVTLATGTFSSTPICMGGYSGGAATIVAASASTATSVLLTGLTDAGANQTSFIANLICVGPK